MADDQDPRHLGVEYLPVPFGQSNPPVPVTQPAYFPVVVSAPRTVPWYLDIGGVLQRHWFLMFLALLSSGLSGYLIGTTFKTNLWTVEGRLRFTAQRSDPGRFGGGYDSMTLYSYADLFTNEELLKPIGIEFADRLPRDNPVRYLQKETKIDTPRMAEQIEVKYDAADTEFGLRLVNRLMERHVEFTNQLRRNAVLQSAGKLLEHKIADAGSTIKRLQNACEEYRARLRADVPIEKLETAELDAYHSQRRKSLLEEIDKQKSEIRKTRLGLDSKRLKVLQQKELVARNALAPQDLETSQQELASAEKQIRIDEDQLKRAEEKYRLVPIEYAESEILRLETQKTVAQQDLKLLVAKVAAAKAQNVSLYFVDPNDEEWQRLRLQLLGPDNPEFSILKVATAPLYPTVSNRKWLTMFGFAVPFGCFYLALAGYDRLASSRKRPANRTREPSAEWDDGYKPPTAPSAESPLMKARVHQWLNGSIPPRRPGKADDAAASPHD
jgi:hypothetical protein